MLVRFEDIKGKVWWVNPTHVKAVQVDKKGKTEIILAHAPTWSSSFGLKVDRPIDEVAEVINAAMPELELAPPGAMDDPSDGDDGTSTMIAAGII